MSTYYSFIDPKNDWLSWPCWLTYSEGFTPVEVTCQLHVMAQARESLPVIDRRSNDCATPPNVYHWREIKLKRFHKRHSVSGRHGFGFGPLPLNPALERGSLWNQSDEYIWKRLYLLLYSKYAKWMKSQVNQTPVNRIVDLLQEKWWRFQLKITYQQLAVITSQWRTQMVAPYTWQL